MKQIVFALFLMLTYAQNFAQNSYWQQEVNYKINVTLDDSSHTVSGNVEMEYINNAPNSLDFIYIHLWANAFQNRSTAFAEQQLRNGNTEFYFAKAADLGGYSDLNFTVNGQSARLEYDAKNPDIAKLYLPEPLVSKARITIATPFTLQVPASFSRLGHVGASYQMTQWYPKPAVYDQDGWHPMPYLDLGEFYAEFGSFEVSITLPENYVVGATGVLQTESEQVFLQKKVEETKQYFDTALQDNSILTKGEENNDFPASSVQMKTIRYTADQVHDFAWFADKRFMVDKSAVTLASGRTIDTWVMFTATERYLWKDAINYVDRSVKFYSDFVGEYPYPQATAVQSALSAGGGMEYPMITVIGPAFNAQNLDVVITHEVGHNWFYGILASNERNHAWMDEGINSYYEKRYTKKYYPDAENLNILPEFLTRGSELELNELAYLWQARRDLDQAPNVPSEEMTEINYFLSAYEKPAAALQYLEAYIGTEAFDAAMQTYYQQWQFQHPQPEDFRAVLEAETDKNLAWLFDNLLYSNAKQDYAIVDLEEGEESYLVTIKNKGKVDAPFTLDAIVDGNVEYSQWYEGFSGEQTLAFDFTGFEQITLDANRVSLDVNRKNNHITLAGKKVEPFQLRYLPGPENDKRTQLFWSPIVGWNNYDKFMLGLALYNTSFPFKNFDFTLLPMYSFGSKDIIGLADLQYHLYPGNQVFQEITFGLNGKTFHYNRRARNDYDLKFARLVPFVNIELYKKPTSNFHQNIQWRSLWLNQELPTFSAAFGNYIGNRWEDTFIHELSYFGESRRALNPFSVFLALEQQSYTDILGKQDYVKVSLELKQSFTYAKDKNIDFRIFVGGFVNNSRRESGAIFPGAFNLTSQGFNDYRYDDFYFGRNADEGIWSQQVTIRDGGMKTAFGPGFSIGRSNNYILALNFKADLPNEFPLPLPIKPYFDIGYFDNAMPTGADDTFEDQVMWSGGLALEFVDEVFGIYFPLVNSQNVQDRFDERGNYWNRIAFVLDLNKLNPKRLLRRVEF